MNVDFTNITSGISNIIEGWEKKLLNLPQETISEKRNNQNRTIKQILGHMIDSASNNHQRIIRLQYNKMLIFPDYRQNNDLWINLQDYQNADWNNMIQLWRFFNIHMIQVIKNIDQSKLNNTWTDFEGNVGTLKEMIEGYL